MNSRLYQKLASTLGDSRKHIIQTFGSFGKLDFQMLAGVFVACLIVAGDQPSNEVAESRAAALAVDAVQRRSLLPDLAGRNVVVNLIHAFTPTEVGLLERSLVQSGAVLIKAPHTTKPPAHPDNLSFAADNGVDYWISGINSKRPGVRQSSKNISPLVSTSVLTYTLTVFDNNQYTESRLELSATGFERLSPTGLFVFGLLVYLLIVLAFGSIGGDKRLGVLGIPIATTYVATVFAEGTWPGASFAVPFVAIATILVLRPWRKKDSDVTLSWSVVLAILFLVALIGWEQPIAVLTALVLLASIHPSARRVMLGFSMTAKIVEKFSALEGFYRSLDGSEQRKGRIPQDLTNGWRYWSAWVGSALLLAFMLHLLDFLIDPTMFFLGRSTYGVQALALAVISSLVISPIQTIALDSVFCILFVRPLVRLRSREPIDPDGRRPDSSGIAGERLRGACVVLGSALMFPFYVLPWVHGSHLLAYLEHPGWATARPGWLSGSDLVQLSFGQFGWLSTVIGIAWLAAMSWGLLSCLPKSSALPRARRFSIYRLALTTGEIGKAILAIPCLSLLYASAGLLLMCSLVFPLYLGVPGIFGIGLIGTVPALLVFSVGLGNGRLIRVTRGVVGAALVLAAGFGVYLSFTSLFPAILNSGQRFASLERMLQFSWTLGSEPAAESDTQVILIPAGPYLSGDIGNFLYNQYGHSTEPDGSWRGLGRFYIDAFEVTNSDYRRFVDTHSTHKEYQAQSSPEYLQSANVAGEDSNATHPVVNVSWSEASAYCESKGGRLPTSEEWEKAARGVNGKSWPWGNTELAEPAANAPMGHYRRPYESTAPVGSFSEDLSTWGVYDLAGNVAEWVFVGDVIHADSPYRGLGWDDFGMASNIAVANLMRFATRDSRSASIGFRCSYDTLPR